MLNPGQSTDMVGPAKRTEYDAVVVGGGLAGLYSIYRLRELGMSVRVFEAGSGVGGTWFWNRYPGARCDVESLQYSYSFSEALQQEWEWPERYPTQPEILKYINHVAERFDLLRDVQLNTRVLSAEYDPAANRWTLETDQGDVVSAPYCIMAAGNLSTPRVPDIAGVERFQGKHYHTGLWPHEGVDFSGQRVGVIGTGSSGIQMIPMIARQAKHLYVFQRTANFSLPAFNRSIDKARERDFKSRYAEVRAEARDSFGGLLGWPLATKSALEATPAERERVYEERWADGTVGAILTAYTDILTNAEANETAAEFVRNKIRRTVKDPQVAELLCPDDHPIGSKRLCLDSGYYETYNRDNVTLVALRHAPIQQITPTGARTDAAEYELDALVFATGFDAMTGALREIDIRVKGGLSLAEHWDGGPQTYLGIMVSGFPNMFMITGPGSPGVKAQMISAIEQHMDWIADYLATAQAKGYSRIEATREAELSWGAHVTDVANGTLFVHANSWYLGANVPGKPRVFMPYVGGFNNYSRKCAEVAANGYEGFRLTR